MRISVFPKGDLDALMAGDLLIPTWIEQMATLPVEGVELYAPLFFTADEPLLDEVAAALAATGLEMPMFCASPDFTHPDERQRRYEIEQQAAAIEVAHRLGGPGVSCRVLSGQRHPETTRADGVRFTVAAISELLPLARELDVVLALENHYKDGYWEYPEFAQRAEIYLDILGQIEERVHFGVQYDPSNAVVAGEDSADFLERVVDRVVTMQASDRSLAEGVTLADLAASDGTIGYSPQLQHGVIGRGVNDYPRIFSTLVGAGYDGWISIEDGVNGFEELRASAEFLCQARTEYFSGSTAVSVRSHDLARARIAESAEEQRRKP
jgi:sugar phosphate isomerase/epimerase